MKITRQNEGREGGGGQRLLGCPPSSLRRRSRCFISRHFTERSDDIRGAFFLLCSVLLLRKTVFSFNAAEGDGSLETPPVVERVDRGYSL